MKTSVPVLTIDSEENQSPICNMDILPEEVAMIPFTYLNPQELFTARLVCQRWKMLVDDNFLWRTKIRQDFPDFEIMGKELSDKEPKESYAKYKRYQTLHFNSNWKFSNQVYIASLQGNLGKEGTESLEEDDKDILCALAVSNGHYSCLESTNQTAIVVNNALKFAIQTKNLVVVEYLIEKAKEEERENDKLDSDLQIKAQEMYPDDTVQRINYINANRVVNENYDICQAGQRLKEAAAIGFSSAVKSLLDAKDSIIIVENDRIESVKIAALKNHFLLADLVLERLKSASQDRAINETIKAAVNEDNLPALKCFLEKPGTTSPCINLTFWDAVREGRVSMVEYFLNSHFAILNNSIIEKSLKIASEEIQTLIKNRIIQNNDSNYRHKALRA